MRRSQIISNLPKLCMLDNENASSHGWMHAYCDYKLLQHRSYKYIYFRSEKLVKTTLKNKNSSFFVFYFQKILYLQVRISQEYSIRNYQTIDLNRYIIYIVTVTRSSPPTYSPISCISLYGISILIFNIGRFLSHHKTNSILLLKLLLSY